MNGEEAAPCTETPDITVAAYIQAARVAAPIVNLNPQDPRVVRAIHKAARLSKGMLATYPEQTLDSLPKLIAPGKNIHEKTVRRWISRWMMDDPPRSLRETGHALWCVLDLMSETDQ